MTADLIGMLRMAESVTLLLWQAQEHARHDREVRVICK